MRVAVYWTPPAHDPFWALGSSWLGRDAETGSVVPQPDVPDLPALTESPRRYGFHATLKAPMMLAGSYEAFLEDACALARTLKPARLPPLAIRSLDGFAALCPTDDAPELAALAEAVVTKLDHHRLPEAPDKQASRARGRTPAQRAYLGRWGYPFVLDEWRFHMTLSNTGAATDRLFTAALRHFGAVLEREQRVGELAVFVEPEPGADFHLVTRLALAA
ncbi:MAG TPA: DUF1045 domain-containing protein [Acetobacteraceae bacterium]|nr:DUF1045 domain-containing protein [Acetobacteraceae bacterium]